MTPDTGHGATWAQQWIADECLTPEELPDGEHRFSDGVVFVASSKPTTKKGVSLDDLKWTPVKTIVAKVKGNRNETE